MLKGKTTVIIGGTTGIGASTVRLFAENRANVVFAGRKQVEGEALQKECAEKYPEACVRFYRMDVSVEEEVKAMAEYVEKEFGGCDVLFNNAGIHLAGKILETPPSDFDRIMSIDCRGVYMACYYFLPMMVKKQYGTIINMSSVSGICADYSMAAYNTAKGAVTNLTRAIAIDYASEGIRCNAICPGAVRTEMLEYTFRKIDYAERVNREAYPTHTFATPEEIAEVALFLAERKVDFLNGVNLPVDGGITCHTGQPRY